MYNVMCCAKNTQYKYLSISYTSFFYVKTITISVYVPLFSQLKTNLNNINGGSSNCMPQNLASVVHNTIVFFFFGINVLDIIKHVFVYYSI